MAVRVLNTKSRLLTTLSGKLNNSPLLQISKVIGLESIVFVAVSKLINRTSKVIGKITAVMLPLSLLISQIRKVFNQNSELIGSISKVFITISEAFGKISVVIGTISVLIGKKITNCCYKIQVFNYMNTVSDPIDIFSGRAVYFIKQNDIVLKKIIVTPPSNYVPHTSYRYSAGGTSSYTYWQRFWMNQMRRFNALWISLKLLFNNLKSTKLTRKKVIISFVHFAVNELIGFAWFVLSKMTGNADFTTPDPTLAEVKTLLEDLETKNTAAMDGGRTAHAQMLEAKNKLLVKLRSLGLYVEKVANGNLAIMLSSGFPVSRDHTPGDREDFWAVYGINSGEILVGCKAFPKSRSYVWQRFVGDAPPTDDNLWIWCGVSTKTRMGLTNLDRGKVVWLRYCAVTAAGMQSWSNPISIMVV